MIKGARTARLFLALLILSALVFAPLHTVFAHGKSHDENNCQSCTLLGALQSGISHQALTIPAPDWREIKISAVERVFTPSTFFLISIAPRGPPFIG